MADLNSQISGAVRNRNVVYARLLKLGLRRTGFKISGGKLASLRLTSNPSILAVIALLVAACGGVSPAVANAVSAANGVLLASDPANTDHDSLAYLARIDAVLLTSGLGGSESSLKVRLDDLWDARYTTVSGGPGWGLPYAWDAFRDGTTNPPDAIYTYTTAMAALAFLDGYLALEDRVQLDRAKAAVATILVDCWGFEDGRLMSVWYSDQAQDQLGEPYVVHNVSALTLAALARIARYEERPYEPAKRRGIEEMLIHHSGYQGVKGQWQYQIGRDNRNDLVHHAYIALGLAEAQLPEAEAAIRYMWSEWFDESTGAFDATNREVMGSTAWGPGDALLALTASADWEHQAELLTNQLLAKVSDSGIPGVADPDAPRSVVRYGLGPALYAARASGAIGLFPDGRCDANC